MKKSISLKDGICVLECSESNTDVCCDCTNYNNCHFVSRDKRGIVLAVLFSAAVYLILFIGVLHTLQK